jgi:hypothetical protein
MVMRMVVEFTREVGPAEEGKEGKVGDTRKRSEPTVAGQTRPSTQRWCLPPTTYACVIISAAKFFFNGDGCKATDTLISYKEALTE